VRLISSDGALVELRPVGYQFSRPGSIGDAEAKNTTGSYADWDANWLLIGGDIRTPDGRSWRFNDPCLTTWEAEHLAMWLHAAASDDEITGLEVMFTEPNLSFILDGRDGERVRIRVCFSQESLPDWMPRDFPGWHAEEYFLPLDISCSELAEAARSWDLDRRRFPAR
jgi:hypothetical protein